MTSRGRCLLLALAAFATGCGDDKEPVIGNAKPVKPGAVRKALDTTDLQFRYRDLAAPRSAGVSDTVAGEVQGRDGSSREFAVWVVGNADPASSGFDPDWEPRVKGDPGGSSGCGTVKYTVGLIGDQNDPGEIAARARVEYEIQKAVCELAYGKGVVLPP